MIKEKFDHAILANKGKLVFRTFIFLFELDFIN